MTDIVNNPPHYKQGKFEVIEFLEDQFGTRPHEFNAAKYICRAPYKGREIEDLEKAVWFLCRKIEVLKAQTEDREVTSPSKMKSPLDKFR